MCSAYESAKKLNAGDPARIGIGIVTFTQEHLLDTALELKPEAIVSHLIPAFF